MPRKLNICSSEFSPLLKLSFSLLAWWECLNGPTVSILQNYYFCLKFKSRRSSKQTDYGCIPLCFVFLLHERQAKITKITTSKAPGRTMYNFNPLFLPAFQGIDWSKIAEYIDIYSVISVGKKKLEQIKASFRWIFGFFKKAVSSHPSLLQP